MGKTKGPEVETTKDNSDSDVLGTTKDVSDLGCKGLRLRVPKGVPWRFGSRVELTNNHLRKGWRFLFAYRRPKDQAAQKMLLGKVGEKLLHNKQKVPLTLALAHRLVDDYRAEVRKGIDPVEAKREEREATEAQADVLTFAKVCAAFEEEELDSFRPATAAGWRRYLAKEIIPALGTLAPEAVTAEHIAEMRATIERGIPGPKAKDGSPTWKRKPAPTSARRAFEVVRRVLEWATTADPNVSAARKRHGLARLEVNVAAAAKGYRSRRQRRNGRTRAEGAAKALTDEQLPAIFQAADAEITKAAAERIEWEARHPEATRGRREASTVVVHEVEARSFRNLLALVAHTAVRAHDARAARWEDIDEKSRKLWTIAEHKTSDHTGAPHVVPLSAGAVSVLASIKAANLAAGYGKSPWLFPAETSACEVCERDGHIDKDSKAALRIKTAAGVGGRGLLHRMRDTIKTRMSEHGIDGRVSEAVLAHVPPGIVGTYDHAELLPQRREALEWWSGELARLLQGERRVVNASTAVKPAAKSGVPTPPVAGPAAAEPTLPGAQPFVCFDCDEECTETELTVVRECTRDSCGEAFNDGTDERECPQCGSSRTRTLHKRGCPSCDGTDECEPRGPESGTKEERKARHSAEKALRFARSIHPDFDSLSPGKRRAALRHAEEVVAERRESRKAEAKRRAGLDAWMRRRDAASARREAKRAEAAEPGKGTGEAQKGATR